MRVGESRENKGKRGRKRVRESWEREWKRESERRDRSKRGNYEGGKRELNAQSSGERRREGRGLIQGVREEECEGVREKEFEGVRGQMK